MKPERILGVFAAVLFCASGQPAVAGNMEEIERCAEAIHTGRQATVTVGGFKFMCRNTVVVSTDPLLRGMATFPPNHAHFEGNFVRVNRVIANDRVRFFITVENWADTQNCRMADPIIKVERKSRLIKIAEYIPNWKDWKSLPKKIDGRWETAALAIAAGAVGKWHQSHEFSKCRRDW